MTSSYAQSERQRARAGDGRYRQMNRCEVCNKPLGSNYCSDGRFCDSLGIGLVLCGPDALKLSDLSPEDAVSKINLAAARRRERGTANLQA